MTKQLYEEALADVKKVKEVAEANAQRAILEAVTPRIRDMIERELLREHGDMDDDLGAPGGVPPEGELMTDLVMASPSADAVAPAAAITPPDAEGKVTLDLDALCADPAGVAVAPPVMGAPLPGEEYELNLESIAALAPVLKVSKVSAAKEFELKVYRMGETVEKFKKASLLVRESAGFHSQIAEMIAKVEDMYDYVQESVVDPAKKSSYETKLESYFRELNKLQEPKMSRTNKKMMNEEDVTLKLTGLPDDMDLESVGVDLITGEEDGEGDDAFGDAEGGDEGGDDSGLGDLDLGGDEGGEEDNMGESRRLSDDTIVEIDEGMLRREIARMRKLREEAAPSNAGNGVGPKEFDDFGGAKDDGEPITHAIADKSPAKAALPLGEADEMDEADELDELDESDDQMDEADELDEQDQLDEFDAPMDQIGDKRTRDDFGASATSVPSADKDNPAARHESLQRRSAFEARLQERAKNRAAALKSEVRKARAKKDLKKEAALKKEYAQVANRFNESVDRSKKIKKLMAEAKLQNGQRQNGSLARSAGSKTEASLRNKLAETNLINAKLLFTNKLLQNESLTSRQKAKVIEQLDTAKTVREAKLVYDSLARTLGGTSKSVNENRDRKVIGNSSRVTRPASTQSLNEGYEAERWARLAGINK